ncbi:TCP family transcription factor 4 [Striga asiatica]|uniref:TCP family transcription factor 4 n=1 Tax=Striga asiatica TaxID=4170 RepID=A0A5A7R7V7_STRAF|nr:TCP family transcription factor 4 [Striga asiatica]
MPPPQPPAARRQLQTRCSIQRRPAVSLVSTFSCRRDDEAELTAEYARRRQYGEVHANRPLDCLRPPPQHPAGSPRPLLGLTAPHTSLRHSSTVTAASGVGGGGIFSAGGGDICCSRRSDDDSGIFAAEGRERYVAAGVVTTADFMTVGSERCRAEDFMAVVAVHSPPICAVADDGGSAACPRVVEVTGGRVEAATGGGDDRRPCMCVTISMNVCM